MMIPIISLLQGISQTPYKLQQIIDRCTADPKIIIAQIQSATPQQTEWGFPNVIHHLILSEAKFLARFKRITAEQTPQLTPFTAADEPPHKIADSIEKLLHQLKQHRQVTIQYLRTLTPDDWHKEAYHPDYGQATLHFHVQNMFTHDRKHINQMQKIADKLPSIA